MSNVSLINGHIDEPKRLLGHQIRQYLFRGIRVDNSELVEGYLSYNEARKQYYIMDDVNAFPIPVYEESVGEYTGMNEFVLTDESRNAKLFEGDIVEVWGWRTVCGQKQSQYDKRIKVRGVIRFQYGEWQIDYNNNYNRSLAALKGNEVYDRDVEGAGRLYYYGCHRNDIDEYRARQLEWHRKFRNDEDIVEADDIKRIGTEFENSELLEG
jgi:hypothetical protein